MYSTTKSQIIEIIGKYGHSQVKELVQSLGITQAAVHRALNKLMRDGLVTKKGTPPQVFYFLNQSKSISDLISLNQEKIDLLEKHYSYIQPNGLILPGLKGFLSWMRKTENKQKPENCIEDYLKILQESLQHKNNSYQLIDATERFQKIFDPSQLDRVFYHDFYSLIKFGKTKLGQFLLNGKQSQSKKMIQEIASMIKPEIVRLIRTEKIDSLVWVPHSIPRKIPFLKELERCLHLEQPKIEVKKVYSGNLPIAQKSLSKLSERIENAKETMVVIPQKITSKRLLLIDDAVGSGATMNEIAKKLRAKGAKKIIGFAIVGSYKGFEVIREV